jgi:hypothetical protein
LKKNKKMNFFYKNNIYFSLESFFEVSVMKYIALIFCLALCCCSFKGTEAIDKPDIGNSGDKPIQKLECSPDNTLEYFLVKEEIPAGYDGFCGYGMPDPPEKLFVGAQEGITCVKLNTGFWLTNRYREKCKEFGVKDGVEDEPGYCSVNHCGSSTGILRNDDGVPMTTKVLKIECPLFTVSQMSGDTMHILFSKNETGEERDFSIGISMGNCGWGIPITQLAE